MAEDSNNEKDFCIEKAKTGRAACRKCKQKCETGVLRIAKLVPNYFSDGGGKLKQWYHVDCLFDMFKTQKASTKRIESVDDMDGWDLLGESDRDYILEKFEESLSVSPKKGKNEEVITKLTQTTVKDTINRNCDDNLFKTFRNICDKISSVGSYNQKSLILQSFLIRGSNGKKFEGDIYLWFKLLLPSAVKRVYNLQSKQLIKLFSRIFRTDSSEMLIDLEQGDVSETIRKYFGLSRAISPKIDNKLTVYDVDEFLDKLTRITREDDQIDYFQKFCQTCSADDLKMVIRLIKHDLRINAGPRHILDALSPLAYSNFQSSRDLAAVVERFASSITHNSISLTESTKKVESGSGGVQLMCPISPMLAEACKSVEKAIEKNPGGVYSEIKYDGERVQIHKRGSEFKFFTRNLKPVMDHKISRCKEFIPKAFPSGQDMILDSEIIVVNTKTGELLPFGTLGVHKREQFDSAEVCLFVFDCIYYNGQDLTKKPLKERKKILKDNMKPIKHHVQMSEYYHLKTKSELASMTANVLKEGLEGLVLKNVNSLYEPGKRGWLKVKKDYLFQGQMADSADLVVLGAWFGTGKKGGLLSIFLMGCHDSRHNKWKTVTKVHSGLDDTTIDTLQVKLKPLMERSNPDKPPNWLSCKKQLMPDFVAVNPSKMPVWEITGAEFSKAEAHTANGISIRFPRITKMRHDKSTSEATNLEELEQLFKNSKEHINVDMLFQDVDAKDAVDFVNIKTKLFDANRSFEDDDDDDDENDNNEQVKDDDDVKGLDKKKESSSMLVETKQRKRKSNDEQNDFPGNKKRKMKVEDDGNVYKNNASCSSSTGKKLKADSSQYISNKVVNAEDTKQSGNVHRSIKVKKDPSLVFDGIKLYVKASARQYCTDAMKTEFLEGGGVFVEDSMKATHVIHSKSRTRDDFMALRRRYKPQCRHVTYSWLQDCLSKNDLLHFGKYGVYLSSS